MDNQEIKILGIDKNQGIIEFIKFYFESKKKLILTSQLPNQTIKPFKVANPDFPASVAIIRYKQKAIALFKAIIRLLKNLQLRIEDTIARVRDNLRDNLSISLKKNHRLKFSEPISTYLGDNAPYFIFSSKIK